MLYPYEKNKPLEEYIRMKIKMLRKDFCINLTDDELNHLREKDNEHDIDRYARDIIKKHLEEFDTISDPSKKEKEEKGKWRFTY